MSNINEEKKYKLVQMNMNKATLTKVESIKNRLNCDRTQAVKASIDITDMITEILSNGGKIFLEEINGEKSKLKIPSLNNG
jgi:hypothetical protein